MFLVAPFAIALCSCWGPKRGAISSLLTLVLIAFLAHAIGTIEEHLFVRKHIEGIGPTPRVLDSSSWLAYDAATGKLTGAD
jgi:hypothetical protein